MELLPEFGELLRKLGARLLFFCGIVGFAMGLFRVLAGVLGMFLRFSRMSVSRFMIAFVMMFGGLAM